jgi:hypothetical protein
MPKMPPQNKLIDLQVYQEPKKPMNPELLKAKQAMGNTPIPPIALTSPFMPPQFQNYYNNFMKQFYTPFVYKDYNINIGGPNANHVHASILYEDLLPSVEINTSFKSLNDRINLCDFIRSTFLKKYDGEQTSFDGNKNSLNARLKLIELNPFGSTQFSNNPYYSLPNDMLIYTSCYPIVFDNNNYQVQCSKNSVGINLRVYQVDTLAFIAKYKDFDETLITEIYPNYNNIQNINRLNYKNYNVWREIDYYNYIRDKIVKDIISPNFIQSYCNFIDVNANISFQRNNNLNNNVNNNQLDTNTNTNIVSIILTESPNKNIIQWATNYYKNNRNVNTLVYSGFKTEKVWKNIIIQMLLSFFVMYKYEFVFTEMSLENNFYIKDLNIKNINSYWIYNVEGIDFYIPNYGYLLLIDHSYNNNNKYKIISKQFDNNSEDIKKCVIENSKKCLNENNFTTENFKGIKPPASILNYINNINKLFNDNNNEFNDNNNEFKNIICESLKEYVHNRVGTPLRSGPVGSNEVNYIIKNNINPFRSGQLIIFEEKFDSYIIVLFICYNDENYSKCITKDNINNQNIIKELPNDLLYHYSEFETISQDIKSGDTIFTEENLIEKYCM